MNEAKFYERQCLIYHNWLSDLLSNISITYKDGRVLTGIDIIDLIRTIPGVGSRYGEVFIAEAGIDVVKRFGNPLALEQFAGFDPSKTYSADKILSKKSRKGNKFIHTTTIEIAQGMLQHGKQDNPLAKWGRSYKQRMEGTTTAHKHAASGIGKRIIRITYHIIRTGKPYDGSRYNYNAHQTKTIKQLKNVATRANNIATEIHKSKVDDTTKAIATEAINALSSIAGIEGGFTLNSNITDLPVTELGFKTRTTNILLKANITNFSMLWFRLIQGKLLDIDGFGKKSYNEVIQVLVDTGYILKKKI